MREDEQADQCSKNIDTSMGNVQNFQQPVNHCHANGDQGVDTSQGGGGNKVFKKGAHGNTSSLR